ncbi:MAG: hypothetical protein ACLGPL_05340 [Acidobacteriota bacterium]
MNDRIVHADKKLRKTVILALIALMIVGGLCHWYVAEDLRELQTLSKVDPEGAIAGFKKLLTVIAAVNGLISVVFTVYFFFVGHRTWQSGIYPPEGLRVIKDTVVRTGAQAKLMALVHFTVAAVILSTNFLIWRIYLFIDETLR